MMNRDLDTRKNPTVFVLSAPSGTGKTTICSALLKKDPDLERVVTVTTRQPRKNEKNGRDYMFVALPQFQRSIAQDEFLEYARVHGDMYGTPLTAIDKVCTRGKNPVLVIDVQGGLQVKKKIADAVLIFVKPPSMKELKERLVKRGLDSAKTIKERLKNTKTEMNKSSRYHYVIVNENLAEAVRKIAGIVKNLK